MHFISYSACSCYKRIVLKADILPINCMHH